VRDVGIDRRAFLRGVAGVTGGALSITACGSGTDRTTSGTRSTRATGTLVVRDSGGVAGEAKRKAVYDPFTKETGIRIRVVKMLYPEMLDRIKAGRPPCDVMDTNMSDLLLFQRAGAVEELDHDRLRNTRNAGIATSLLTSYGVGKEYWASVMAYRTDAFGGRRPESWADFWDTGAFPGSRALQSAMDWPELEFALLADGVPMDRLYPLDVDRAFRALDRIKDSVRRFWDDGNAPGVLLDRKEVVASTVWSGRLTRLMADGAPLAYQWNGARRQTNGYGIPKGASNVDAAYRLIDFAMRPEVQAGLARIYPLGPVVPAAYASIPSTAAADLASSPGHLQTGFDLDIDWWIKNQAPVTRRWQEWIRS
jgi:putative spermidine/putrescine transport system substrate-binding protein